MAALAAMALPEPSQVSLAQLTQQIVPAVQSWRERIRQARDLAAAEDLQRRWDAFARYVHGKGLSEPLKEQSRRNELLIGELLGPAKVGSNQYSEPPPVGGGSRDAIAPDDRVKFQLLAKPEHRGLVEGLLTRKEKPVLARNALVAEGRRAEAAERGKKAPAQTPRYTLLEGDCFAHDARFSAAPFDCIITDPPYGVSAEAVDGYERLAAHARRWLKPGGSLVAMAGQLALPSILPRMAQHLTYRWVLAYLTPGGQSVQIWPSRVNAFWKPVVWLTNGPYDGSWIGDVCKSATNDNDKALHDWGQSESGITSLVLRFVSPGVSVLDPFMGSGTTGVVALRAGCVFTGCERDGAALARARGRLAASQERGA